MQIQCSQCVCLSKYNLLYQNAFYRKWMWSTGATDPDVTYHQGSCLTSIHLTSYGGARQQSHTTSISKGVKTVKTLCFTVSPAKICRVVDCNYQVMLLFDSFLSGKHEEGVKMEELKNKLCWDWGQLQLSSPEQKQFFFFLYSAHIIESLFNLLHDLWLYLSKCESHLLTCL